MRKIGTDVRATQGATFYIHSSGRPGTDPQDPSQVSAFLPRAKWKARTGAPSTQSKGILEWKIARTSMMRKMSWSKIRPVL